MLNKLLKWLFSSEKGPRKKSESHWGVLVFFFLLALIILNYGGDVMERHIKEDDIVVIRQFEEYPEHLFRVSVVFDGEHMGST